MVLEYSQLHKQLVVCEFGGFENVLCSSTSDQFASVHIPRVLSENEAGEERVTLCIYAIVSHKRRKT